MEGRRQWQYPFAWKAKDKDAYADGVRFSVSMKIWWHNTEFRCGANLSKYEIFLYSIWRTDLGKVTEYLDGVHNVYFGKVALWMEIKEFSTIHILPKASFDLQVLLMPASICQCVDHLFVRAITRDQFKLGSSNLDQRCKKTSVKIPVVLWITKFGPEVQNTFVNICIYNFGGGRGGGINWELHGQIFLALPLHAGMTGDT